MTSDYEQYFLSGNSSTLHNADKSCELSVMNGKVWCEHHRAFHPTSKWDEHASHRDSLVQVAFRHVLYVGFVCSQCKDGKILIDEEQ